MFVPFGQVMKKARCTVERMISSLGLVSKMILKVLAVAYTAVVCIFN